MVRLDLFGDIANIAHFDAELAVTRTVSGIHLAHLFATEGSQPAHSFGKDHRVILLERMPMWRTQK